MAASSSQQPITVPTSVSDIVEATTVKIVFGLIWSHDLVGKANLSKKYDYKTNLLLGLSKLRTRFAMASPLERSIISKSHAHCVDVTSISPSIGKSIAQEIFGGSFFDSMELSNNLIENLITSEECYTYLQGYLKNEATNIISCTTEPASVCMFLVLGFSLQVNGNINSFTGYQDLFDAWMKGNNNPLYHPRVQVDESASRIHALVWKNRDTTFVPAACPEVLQNMLTLGQYDYAYFLTNHWSSSTAEFNANVAEVALIDIYTIPSNSGSGGTYGTERSAIYKQAKVIDQMNINMINLLSLFSQSSYIPIHQLFYPFGCTTSNDRFEPTQYLVDKSNNTLAWSFSASNIRLDEGVLTPQAHHRVVLDVFRRAIAEEATKSIFAQFVDDQNTADWSKLFAALQSSHIIGTIQQSYQVLGQSNKPESWPGFYSTVERITTETSMDDASGTLFAARKTIVSVSQEQDDAWSRFSFGIRMPPSSQILSPGQDSITEDQVAKLAPDNAIRFKSAVGTLGNPRRQLHAQRYRNVALNDDGFKPSTAAPEVINLGAMSIVERQRDERVKYQEHLLKLMETAESFFLAASQTHPLGGVGYLYTNYNVNLQCLFSSSKISIHREAIGLVNEARRRLHLAEQFFLTESSDSAHDLLDLPHPFIWMYIDESINVSKPIKMQLRIRQDGAIRIAHEWTDLSISNIWNNHGLFSNNRLIGNVNAAFGDDLHATLPGLNEEAFALQFGDLNANSSALAGDSIFTQVTAKTTSFFSRLANSASNMIKSRARMMISFDESADSSRLIPVYGQLVQGDDLVSIEGNVSNCKTLASYIGKVGLSPKTASGFGFLEWLTCTQLVNCFVSLAAALVHLDVRGMTHVSVSPENVFISQTKQASLGNCASNLGIYDTMLIIPSKEVGQYSVGKVDRAWSIRLFGRFIRQVTDDLAYVFDYERYNTIAIRSKTSPFNRHLLLSMFGMIKNQQDVKKILQVLDEVSTNCIENAELMSMADVYASLLPIQIYALAHCE